MQASSSLSETGRLFELIYKFALTLFAGALIAGLAAAGLHAHEVRAELAQAERLFSQGRLQEADAALAAIAAWSRCFPGRYREGAALRVRCLARSGQAGTAVRIADSMRGECDEPVSRPALARLTADPFGWLHEMTLAMVSGLAGGLAPPTLHNEWAGYEVLIEELIAVRDRAALNALADDLYQRVPNTLIALKAGAARAELSPAPATRPPQPGPKAEAVAESAPSAVTPEIPGEQTAALPAAPEPEAPVSTTWGIVTNTRAVAFNPQTGQPIRELKPGDVLAIEGTGVIRKEPALTGTLILNNRNVPGLAFRAEDLEIRPGSFNAVSPQEVALRSRLAEIRVEEVGLALKVAREKTVATPEEKAYKEAQARFDAFQAEAASLSAQLEKSSGAERMRVLDKLRSMKYQEQTLLRELTPRKQAFEKAGGQVGKSGVEQKLTALRQEKQAILKRLAAPAS